jgi:hypothetical protein
VRTKACIKLSRQTRGWGRAVAFAGARIPPAALLKGFGGIGNIDDAVNLIVLGIARLKVVRTSSHVHRFAIDKPDRMNTA